MYIDFHKYNYDLISESDRKKYIERDKKAYEHVIRVWFEKHIKEMVGRKWEIEEILYLTEAGDFVKLLKEAENLYELGFFTACIALVGVSTEDFTKYIALKTNNCDLLDKGVSQSKRLQELRVDKIISEDTYNDLDRIRQIRNDCLHFNEGFKRKKEDELKNDALSILGSIKKVLTLMLGIKKDTEGTINIERFSHFMEKFVEEMKSEDKYTKGIDDVLYKLRNSVSHLLGIPIAFGPEEQRLIFEGLYKVENINFNVSDFGEVDFVDLTRGNMIVIVDLDKESRQQLKEKNVQRNDTLYAIVYSDIDEFGQSGIWHLLDFQKLS